MRTRARLLSLALLLLAALPTGAAELAGRWTAEFDTQVGPQTYVFTFAVAGQTVTGTAAFERMGEKGEATLLEVKLADDKLTFAETFDAMGATVRIDYEGTVKGDEIAFVRKVGDFGSETFVAKRVKD